MQRLWTHMDRYGKAENPGCRRHMRRMPFPGYSPERMAADQTGKNSAVCMPVMRPYLHSSADIKETAPASSITLFLLNGMISIIYL